MEEPIIGRIEQLTNYSAPKNDCNSSGYSPRRRIFFDPSPFELELARSEIRKIVNEEIDRRMSEAFIQETIKKLISKSSAGCSTSQASNPSRR